MNTIEPMCLGLTEPGYRMMPASEFGGLLGPEALVDWSGTSASARSAPWSCANPLDAVFLDDRRVWHGVTPLHVSRPGEPAYRDALVVTFRAEA